MYGAVVIDLRLQHVDHVAHPFAPEILTSCDQLLRCLPKASTLASWIHDSLSKDGPMGKVSSFSDIFL